MAKKNREELEAFAKKMHDEGAAGFAAGLTPWETWDDFEDRVGSRVWQGTSERVPNKVRAKHSFGDRVLTGMTALAVATLAIGIAGVYITHNSTLQLADNSTQLLPASAPDSAQTRQPSAIASGHENVVRDTVTIPAIASAVSLDVDNTTPIDPAAAAPEPQLTDLVSDTALPVAAVADETLLANLELKLASLKQQLANLEQPPAAATDAMPVAQTVAQTAGMDSDIPAPGMTANGEGLLATLEELPATAAGATPVAPGAEQTAGMDSVTAVATADMGNPLTPAALNDPPAPAAVTPQADAPAPVTEMKPESTPAKASGRAPAEPTRLSQLEAPARPSSPLQAAGQDSKETAQTGQRGDWSINLASYTKQSTAEEMRGRFLEKGVAADQVVATVNGKTYFRLRVTGLASRQAALKQSALIKEKLGLKDAWVTKQ